VWLLREWGRKWRAVANLQRTWDVIEFCCQEVGDADDKLCCRGQCGCKEERSEHAWRVAPHDELP
jgi:hypothetical protein